MIIMCWLGLITVPAFGQLVAKRIDAYILIDTDKGLGGIGDTISVFRITEGSLETIGTVTIVRFSRGMTAAKVLQEGARKIGKNDFVSTPATQPYIAGMKQSSRQDNETRILLRNREYALAMADRSLGNPGDVLTVTRFINNALLRVGRVRIVKFVNGKAALKIIEEYAPYRISKDDVLTHSQKRTTGDETMDVDYYYYGAFR